MNTEAEFEKWINRATYSEISKKLPYNPFDRFFPTCLTTDEKTLYVSSIDVYVEISDPEKLEFYIAEIAYRLKSLSEITREPTAKEYLKLGILRSDFNALARYLYDLILIDPSIDLKFDVEYGIPDEALNAISSTIKLGN